MVGKVKIATSTYKDLVDVYWNSHKKLWSLRSCRTRRVLGHTDMISLAKCSMKVSYSGRQRAIDTGRRNVHAYIRGELLQPPIKFPLNGGIISYNPYKEMGFMDRKRNQRVMYAHLVTFKDNLCYYSFDPKDANL